MRSWPQPSLKSAAQYFSPFTYGVWRVRFVGSEFDVLIKLKLHTSCAVVLLDYLVWYDRFTGSDDSMTV